MGGSVRFRPSEQYIRLADWWSTTGSMYEGNRPPGYPYVSNQAAFYFLAARGGENLRFSPGNWTYVQFLINLMPPSGGRKER